MVAAGRRRPHGFLRKRRHPAMPQPACNPTGATIHCRHEQTEVSDAGNRGLFRETGIKRKVTEMISTATLRLPIVSGEKQAEYDSNDHFITNSESRKSGVFITGDVRHPVTYDLDLCGAAAMTRLRLIAAFWPAWPTETRDLWLQRQEIALPPRALCDQDVAILPGGAVTVRGPDGILVCDPAEAVTLAGIEAKELRTTLRRRTDAIHLLHGDSGIVRSMRLPVRLPPQAVSIIQDASRLPGHLASAGPGPDPVVPQRRGGVANGGSAVAICLGWQCRGDACGSAGSTPHHRTLGWGGCGSALPSAGSRHRRACQ